MLREFEEYMLADFRRPFEPVWIVECPAIDTDNVRESLKIEKYFCPASSAETNRQNLPAPCRTMVIGFGSAADDFEVIALEHRLDKIRRARRPLTKPAVAECDSDRFCLCGVPNRTAQTPAFVIRHFRNRPFPFIGLEAPTQRIAWTVPNSWTAIHLNHFKAKMVSNPFAGHNCIDRQKPAVN